MQMGGTGKLMRVYSGGSEELIKYSRDSHEMVPMALFGQLTAPLLPAWWQPLMWSWCQGWGMGHGAPHSPF